MDFHCSPESASTPLSDRQIAILGNGGGGREGYEPRRTHDHHHVILHVHVMAKVRQLMIIDVYTPWGEFIWVQSADNLHASIEMIGCSFRYAAVLLVHFTNTSYKHS